jgi:proline iminopeptidase
MRAHLAASVLGAALALLPPDSSRVVQTGPAAREARIPAGTASLYSREIGRGQPLVVLHGGPDFDISYLLPEMDRFATGYRLIYYDQRGRGRSADGVKAEDVSLASEIADLDLVRRRFQLNSVALVGHSWGAVLALEYALRHADRVSHLVLMNPAPASAADLAVFRKSYLEQLGSDMDRQRQIASGAAYKDGDPVAVAERYRVHFKHALAKPEHYESLMATMKAGFASQGRDGIIKARAVEDRLMADTWQIEGYDLLPKLRALDIPTLVLTGDHDFIPVETAEHIARSIPKARFITLKNCGHFSFLECGADVRAAFDEFFRKQAPSSN